MKTAEVLIVGGGPAGLAAAITLASEGRSVILLEKSGKVGGQAGTSSAIENYPPFSGGFVGSHFTAEACAQCQKFGVQIEYGTEVQVLVPGCGAYTLLTSNGPYHGRAVLLALGLRSNRLNVPGEDLPQVHHGMKMDALVDVAGKHIVLVGGGNSVGQAAVFYLSKKARVTLVARRPLSETMSQYLVHRIVEQVTVDYGSVTKFQEQVSGRVTVRIATAQTRIPLLDVDCVHIFIGQQPGTEWLRGLIRLDERGYIMTDNNHQTSRDGLFAVGDVVSDAVRRVACAVGYGNEVVPVIHRYLDDREHQCYLIA